MAGQKYEIKQTFSIRQLDDRYPAKTEGFRLPQHCILLCEKASGNIRIDDATFSLHNAQLILMARGQVYSFTKNTILQGYELQFADEFWERAPQSANNCKSVLFDNVSINQLLPLDKDHAGDITGLFRTLYEESAGEDYINKADAMAAWLKIIMIKMANINATLINGYDAHEKQVYRQYLDLISQKYGVLHEVAEYATLLNVSTRKLSYVCKKCSGKSPKELINRHLIAEAKRSLQFSSLPVKEIAYRLNFSTPGQFSHFFKKNTQLSPKIYRARFVNISM